jgi:hypothetical protein
MSDRDVDVVVDESSPPAVKIKRKRAPASALHGTNPSKAKKTELVSQIEANCKNFHGHVSTHKITCFRIYDYRNCYKRSKEEFGWPLTGARYDLPHESANVKQWNRWCVNPFQWRLIGDLVNKITNGNYVDNSGPYIETCQTWIALDLCAEEDGGEEYIVATGNMTAIQKHAHANGAMYNADTMGYDPFPASFLPQLIEIAGF